MAKYLTLSPPKIDKSTVALPVLNKLDEYMFLIYNKHLDLQFPDFMLKVLNRLLRLLFF